MVSYAVSSMFFHECSLPEVFSSVILGGLDGIEFWVETPDFWLRDLPAEEVVGALRSNPGISAMTVHAPILDLNPCSINPAVAEISIRYASEAIALAERFGSPVVTLHPGRRTAKRPVGEADFARFGRYLEAIRGSTVRKTPKIAMENMEPAVNSLLYTPERMRELLDAEPWLYFTLDIAHALVRSGDEPARYIELCGDRLVNVHISRVEGKTQHLPLDRSPVMAGVMKNLREIGYDGPLTLEIDDLNFSSRLSREEKIAVIASDCAFMRECME